MASREGVVVGWAALRGVLLRGSSGAMVVAAGVAGVQEWRRDRLW